MLTMFALIVALAKRMALAEESIAAMSQTQAGHSRGIVKTSRRVEWQGATDAETAALQGKDGIPLPLTEDQLDHEDELPGWLKNSLATLRKQAETDQDIAKLVRWITRRRVEESTKLRASYEILEAEIAKERSDAAKAKAKAATYNATLRKLAGLPEAKPKTGGLTL